MTPLPLPTGLALTLGVDPGATGALVLLAPDGAIWAVHDMPEATGAALGAQVAALLEDHAPHRVEVAWVEQVASRPGQSAPAMFTFASGFGAVLGALGALGIPVHLVTPGKWKADQGVTVAKREGETVTRRKARGKALSRQRATELWPAEARSFLLVKHADRAEAALIGRHGQGQALAHRGAA